MILCDSHSFAFIHIQRTGGTTLRQLLHQQPVLLREVGFYHSHSGSKEVTETGFEDYFTFAFVRNPWDRIYSWFSLINNHRPPVVTESYSFARFLEEYPEQMSTYGTDDRFLFNQTDFLKNQEGKLTCQFIGRFEHYRRDIKTLFDQLGFPLTDIPKLNPASSGHYSRAYTPELRRKVARLCADDIETFGYGFEQVSSSVKIS